MKLSHVLWPLSSIFGALTVGWAMGAAQEEEDYKTALQRIEQDVVALSPVNPNSNPVRRMITDEFRTCLKNTALSPLMQSYSQLRKAERYAFIEPVASTAKKKSFIFQEISDLSREICVLKARQKFDESSPVYRLPPVSRAVRTIQA